MEIHHLRYFVEIARNKSFTRAAEQLYITQPMLTRVIKQLEEELDAKLIERTSKSFRLTDVGEAFYLQAQDLLLRYNDLYRTIDDVRSVRSGEVRLSTPGVLLDMYFAPLLAQFRNKFPGIDINIVEEGSKLVVKALLSNQADLGMVMLPVEHSSQFETTVVVRDQVRLMVGKGHRLAGCGQVHIRELKEERFITFGDTATLHDQFIHLCEEHNIYPHVAYKSLMPHFTAELLASSDCVAVMPGPVIQRYRTDELAVLSLEQSLPWEIAVIHRKECYQSYASNKLREFICDYFAALQKAAVPVVGTPRRGGQTFFPVFAIDKKGKKGYYTLEKFSCKIFCERDDLWLPKPGPDSGRHFSPKDQGAARTGRQSPIQPSAPTVPTGLCPPAGRACGDRAPLLSFTHGSGEGRHGWSGPEPSVGRRIAWISESVSIFC